MYFLMSVKELKIFECIISQLYGVELSKLQFFKLTPLKTQLFSFASLKLTLLHSEYINRVEAPWAYTLASSLALRQSDPSYKNTSKKPRRSLARQNRGFWRGGRRRVKNK